MQSENMISFSRSRTDTIVSSVGAMLAVVLLVAGGLLTWGYRFATDTVHDQLAAQQIYFPPAGSSALSSSDIGPYLDQYAGEQLVTGPQAEAYANHFIAVHLTEVANGQTYAQVSAAAQADPNNTQLSSQAETLFKGETLRGLLLTSYAFWQIGQIAMYAAIAAFVAAGIVLVLSGVGFLHARRAAPRLDRREPAVVTS